jgi:hypothetical protein
VRASWWEKWAEWWTTSDLAVDGDQARGLAYRLQAWVRALVGRCNPADGLTNSRGGSIPRDKPLATPEAEAVAWKSRGVCEYIIMSTECASMFEISARNTAIGDDTRFGTGSVFLGAVLKDWDLALDYLKAECDMPLNVFFELVGQAHEEGTFESPYGLENAVWDAALQRFTRKPLKRKPKHWDSEVRAPRRQRARVRALTHCARAQAIYEAQAAMEALNAREWVRHLALALALAAAAAPDAACAR